MQDFPEYDSYLQDTDSRARARKAEAKRQPPSGPEPIPSIGRGGAVTLEIEVLRETYDEILRAIVENEWEREEGLRTVLLTGVGFLDAKLNLDEINKAVVLGNNAEMTRRVDFMVKELAAYHSMYSVMKFKAYKLYKTNQSLELNIAGLREIERTWVNWAERMGRSHSELQAECIRLRALMSEFKLDWDHPLVQHPQQTIPLEQATLPAFPMPDFPALQEPVEVEPAPPALLLSPLPSEPSALIEPRPSFWARMRNFLRGGQ